MTIATPDGTDDWKNDASLSDDWKFRFRFFDNYGLPGPTGTSPEFKAAIKALSVGERIRLSVNLYAFFFTFIYIGFILKLWRQAVVLFAIALGLFLLCAFLQVTTAAINGAVLGYCASVALRTNPLYYLCRTRDMGWRI